MSNSLKALILLLAIGMQCVVSHSSLCAEEQDADAKKFEKPKLPDLSSLASARIAAEAVAQPNIREQQELGRCIRNFHDGNNNTRNKIINILSDYGLMAYPYIDGAFQQPFESPGKAELLRALGVPGNSLAAGIFATSHNNALVFLAQVVHTPPAQNLTKRDRENPPPDPRLDGALAAVLDIELHAAKAGGPLNALFLAGVYSKRYDSDKTDPLLADVARDRIRLAETASDFGKKNSSWTDEDRVKVCEQLLPLLFSDNDDAKILPRDLLKKILPAGAPKWDAPQPKWFDWWQKKSEALKK